MKKLYCYVFLAFLTIVYSLLVPNVYADEWDIFDAIEEEIAAFEGTPGGIDYDSSWQLHTSWQKRWENEESLLQPVSSEDSQYFTIILENEGRIRFGSDLRVSYNGGIWVTSKGKREFLRNHPSVEEDDASQIAFFHVSLHELMLQYPLTEACILEAGLLPQKNLVNSVFLNTGNYLERFFDYSLEIGAYTFPGIKTFFPFGRHALSLMYLPALPESHNPYLADLTQPGKTRNLLALQSSHYPGDGRMSLLAFVEEKQAWTWDRPYLGLGGEIQYPFSSFVLHGQALISNGKAAYHFQTFEPASEDIFLLADEESREVFFGEALMTVEFPLTSSLDLTVGYNYNGRGLSGQEQEALLDSLDHTANDHTLQAASGIGSSAQSYTQHLGLFHLSYPKITENMGANALVFLNLLDGSGKLFASSFIDMTEALTVTVMATAPFGQSVSLFGSESHKASFQFRCDLFF